MCRLRLWRASRGVVVAAGALAVCVLVSAPAGADVVLRSGEVVRLDIAVVGIEGIRVTAGEPARVVRLIPWEDVLRVEGARAADAASYLEMGERAWRARIRLARGDTTLAEPLLERLFEELAGSNGPTALLAAEGLLRCRLVGRDLVGAVPAWLEAVRLRASGTELGSQPPRLGATLDSTTLLSPSLPPFFTPAQARGVVSSLSSRGGAVSVDGDEGDDGIREAMALAEAYRSLYLRAAMADVGDRDRIVGGREPDAGVEEDDPALSGPGRAGDLGPRGRAGVRFLEDVVAARTSASANERALSRNRLRVGLDDSLNTWREAWSRMAIGMSLAGEGDADSSLRGAIYLLHVPARFSETQPHLSGLALVHAGDALERAGYLTQAEALRAEVLDRRGDEPAGAMLRALEAMRSGEASVDDGRDDGGRGAEREGMDGSGRGD